jgi:hypothetical protein
VEDVEVIQEDLVILESWASNNNSPSNGSNYKALRMGPNQGLLDNTHYPSGDGESLVEEESPINDLGVLMSSNGRFDDHLLHAVKKTAQWAAWTLRTFSCREPWFLRQLWRNLVQPHLDYASQLWMPTSIGGILKVEGPLKSYTK